MEHIEKKLRETAARLLGSGEIRYFIGWGATRFPDRTTPLFISSPSEAEKLVFNEHCCNTLAKYLLDDRFPLGRIGLCVRGCDSRAVNRLLKDQQIRRENIYLVGIPCSGMRENGKTLDKCRKCMHPNPVIYDELLGSPVEERPIPDRFEDVEAMENLSAAERYAYWKKEFTRCIRCYACRNVCPACNCVECYVDQYRTGWQGKQNNCAANQNYGLTRAFHVGDRCIECGECERVCPMHLPLMKLNRKLVKDINEMFGDFEGGMDDTAPNALGTFLKDDMDQFM